MNLRPVSNNTAVRIFNGNVAEPTGSGPMVVDIEEGDAVTFSLPPGMTMKLLDTNELGCEQWRAQKSDV